MKEIIGCIQNARTIAISSHSSPDGDAIGSAIGLGLTLKKLGKDVSYNMEEAHDKFNFLKDTRLFKDKPVGKFDLGICVDCSNIDHLHNSAILGNCKKIVNIDHHISNEKYGDLNYVDENASATGEIIYRLIKALDVPIDQEIADCIYTAIVTDTGNFKYSNVTAATHKIIYDLYAIGCNFHDVNRRIFDEQPFERMKLLGKALDNLYLLQAGKVSIMQLNLDDVKDNANVDMEGFINYARDIIGVEVAVFIKEVEKNTFKVSFRSNTDFDVSLTALQFGGGGHSKAAGCTIRTEGIERAVEEILKSIGDLR